ncbi:hypothetical protein LTS10_003666 [Elasticomyces elasticus]|nr:hypothetical protein LTS10_003666 [Elasticomyces elasticus]
MAALLYEWDEVRKARGMMFYYTVKYPAKPFLLSAIKYTVSIKLKSESAVPGVAKIVPSLYLTIAVLLARIPKYEDSDTFLQGDAFNFAPPGYDFAVLADLPPGLEADDIKDGEDRAVHVL